MESISYSTNELENAIDYLEQVNYYHTAIEYQHRFKWLMLSLHGALYGFSVLAIKGTDASQTVFKPLDKVINKPKKLKEIRDAMAKYHDESDDIYIDSYVQYEHGQLLGIYDAIERCQNGDYMNRYTHSKTLVITKNQIHAIGKLIKFRNQFAHFIPMQYAITGDFEQDIVYPTLEVIKFLSLESNNVDYYKAEQKHRVEKALTEIMYHSSI